MKAVSGRGAGCRFFVIEAPKKVTKEDMKIYGIDIDAFVFFCLLCIIFTLLIVEKKEK